MRISKWLLIGFLLCVFSFQETFANSTDDALKAHFAKCGLSENTPLEVQCQSELQKICSGQTGSPSCLKIHLSRAKMAESKKKLASGYMALKMYFLEKNAYPSNFQEFWSIYQMPDDQGTYVLGYPSGCGGSAKPQSSFDLKQVAHSPEADKAKEKIMATFAKPPVALNCLDPKKSFYLMAVGDLGHGQVDVWVINEKREIKHVQNGIVIP